MLAWRSIRSRCPKNDEISLVNIRTTNGDSHVNHGYSDEFLDSDRVAKIYFISDVDAKSRISSLNEFSKINLNEIRRAGDNDDGWSF